MMNVKETLKRLHKKLPAMGLDELFELLDCYVEESYWNKTITSPSWKVETVPCSITTNLNDLTKMYDNGTTTTIKNYANSADVQLNGHN